METSQMYAIRIHMPATAMMITQSNDRLSTERRAKTNKRMQIWLSTFAAGHGATCTHTPQAGRHLRVVGYIGA